MQSENCEDEEGRNKKSCYRRSVSFESFGSSENEVEKASITRCVFSKIEHFVSLFYNREYQDLDIYREVCWAQDIPNVKEFFKNIYCH